MSASFHESGNESVDIADLSQDVHFSPSGVVFVETVRSAVALSPAGGERVSRG